MIPDNKIVYKVGDLVTEMRKLMEVSYPEIWIEGELSSLSQPASGHLYFSLKDDQSQLRCAMFKGRASVNRYRPKAGDLVRVRAKISVYTARGDLQCIVQYIEDAGEGILQRRYEELKAKLNEQGLFSLEHKKKLPPIPKHIGLITSSTGAAVRDILSTLQRRCPGIPVTLYPAIVQGEAAAESLCSALADAIKHQRCDLIIIGRGGGSLEDLWCFNDESVVRAIFDCPIPVVSAVGHEVDVTLSDYAADLRAPTPTAAAELVSPDQRALLSNLEQSYQRLQSSMHRYFERQAQRVDMTSQKLSHPHTTISKNMQLLHSSSKQLFRSMANQLSQREKVLNLNSVRLLRHTPMRSLQRRQNHCASLTKRLEAAKSRRIKQFRNDLSNIAKQLDGVSPLNTLGRGFAVARDAEGKILRSSNSVAVNDKISVQLSEGALSCLVTESGNN